jgi:hypothetical protein
MRNEWNAITEWPEAAKTLKHEAEKAGVFTTGIESDQKQRGSAINCDLYGYDGDLIVVQVRQCIFRPGRYNKVRKDYYLIGKTEAGNLFAHPVETPARSKKALETPEGTVRFVLGKIWDCSPDELPLIKRQGDIAFIPAPLPAGSVETENCLTLRETHKITGRIMRAPDGRLFVDRATARHTKGQHATIKTPKGAWYRIQEGLRAKVWGFTTPKGD